MTIYCFNFCVPLLLLYFIFSYHAHRHLNDNFCWELILVIISWTKTNKCIFCVVRLCETQCLYHVIFLKIYIKPTHAVSFPLPQFFFFISKLQPCSLVSVCDRITTVNMYITISYHVIRPAPHVHGVFVFLKLTPRCHCAGFTCTLLLKKGTS